MMYMVHFGRFYSQRFDDATAMGLEIAEFLRLNPKESVKVELYI